SQLVLANASELDRGADSDAEEGGSTSMFWLLLLLLILPLICILVGLLVGKKNTPTRQVYTCALCRRDYRLSVNAVQPETLSDWVCARCLYSRPAAEREDQAREERVAKRLEELRQVDSKEVRLTKVNTNFYKLRNSIVSHDGTGLPPGGGGNPGRCRLSVPGECIICLEGETACDIVLLPCGHSGLCEACCEDVVRKHEGKCPICRDKIEMIARLKRKTFASAPTAPEVNDLEAGAGADSQPPNQDGSQHKRRSIYLAEVIPCPDASARPNVRCVSFTVSVSFLSQQVALLQCPGTSGSVASEPGGVEAWL
ncbi:hypothetical protein FOZ63_030528, partial [Perkinsus olseni]